MWQTINASVRGTSHVRLGTNCQDAHGYHLIGDRGLIIAVADGLGSAKKSEYGARIAVDTAINIILKTLKNTIPSDTQKWRDLLLSGFSNARVAIKQRATDDESSPREYATTLLIAVIFDDWLAVGHIGDGAVVGLFKDGGIESISLPERGEFANETIPLTSNSALSHVRFVVKQKELYAIALFSDGLQNLALELSTGKPYDGFFNPFFDVITQDINAQEISSALKAFLESDKVCAKTDDDKTLVVSGKILKKDTSSKTKPESVEIEVCPPTTLPADNQSPQETKLRGAEKGLYSRLLDSLDKSLKSIIQIIEQEKKRIN